MTPAKRSGAEADEDNGYESPDERDFSSLRAGSSNSGGSTNEACLSTLRDSAYMDVALGRGDSTMYLWHA
jgi:hypothetical protein